jgi:glycosyltransferase involved in cell wall biosynthesis
MHDLTVGLPVYNGEKYLRETLDALLAQTYSNFELFVSDNASTDSTPAILEEYARRDDRIRIVRQPENRGSVDNFWFLLEEAKTPYFTWFAADDMCAPTFLERTLTELRRTDSIICGTDICVVDGTGETTERFSGLDTLGLGLEGRMHALFEHYGWFAIYGVARRDRLLACGPLKKQFGCDVIKTAEWLMHGDVACVHEPLFLFRRLADKDADTYQDGYAPGTASAKRPLSTMLGEIGNVLKTAGLERDALTDVLGTISRTIAFENPKLCLDLLREQGVAPNAPDLTRYRSVLEALASMPG